jgi:hypothetical protein
MSSSKQRIQSIGNAECPYAHFLPIIEAEKSWGNSVVGDFYYRPREGEWAAVMARPLHLDRLREKFDFPDNIILSSGPLRPAQRPGDMYYSIKDTENTIEVFYLDRHGPSFQPAARFFRRLLRRPESGGRQ